MASKIRHITELDDHSALPSGISDLFNEMRAAAEDLEHPRVLRGLLHAFSVALLPQLCSPRMEQLTPYTATLHSLSAQLERPANSDSDSSALAYLRGWVASMLSLCGIALDRTVSESVVNRVSTNKNALRILALVVNQQEISRSEILRRIPSLGEANLSNLLGWMSDLDLVRKRWAGRSILVGCGAKSEAVYQAIIERRPELAAVEREMNSDTIARKEYVDETPQPAARAVRRPASRRKQKTPVKHAWPRMPAQQRIESRLQFERPNEPIETLTLPQQIVDHVHAFAQQHRVYASTGQHPQPASTLLVSGEPGSGKSSLVRAIATQLDAPYVRIDPTVLSEHDASEVLGLDWLPNDIGVETPAILWLDRIEQLFPATNDAEEANCIEQRLGMLQSGLETQRQRGRDMVVIGEAVDPWEVHPDVGARFEYSYWLHYPDEESRQHLVRDVAAHANVQVEQDVLADVAARLDGMTPQHIVATSKAAVGHVFTRIQEMEIGEPKAIAADFENAIKYSRFASARFHDTERQVRYQAFADGNPVQDFVATPKAAC